MEPGRARTRRPHPRRSRLGHLRRAETEIPRREHPGFSRRWQFGEASVGRGLVMDRRHGRLGGEMALLEVEVPAHQLEIPGQAGDQGVGAQGMGGDGRIGRRGR